MKKVSKLRKRKYSWAETFYESPMSMKQKRIASRLKGYADMESVYAEIEDKIDEKEFPEGRDCFLTDVINAALITEGKKYLRDGQNGLKDLNDLQKKIATQAENLAVLLDRRNNLIASRHVLSNASIKPIDLYREAGWRMYPVERRHSFKKDTWPVFKDYISLKTYYALSMQEPTFSEMLRILSRQMKDNPFEPAHPGMKKINQYRKTSPAADFVRCLSHELSVSVLVGYLPQSFFLSTKAVAKIAEAALELEGGVTERAIQLAVKRSK
ncbi:hypothetical protein BAC1_01586 [uncultured bacterium]|nr:hypothetical protein BAC1_01586 [uncultured bacterium]